MGMEAWMLVAGGGGGVGGMGITFARMPELFNIRGISRTAEGQEQEQELQLQLGEL